MKNFINTRLYLFVALASLAGCKLDKPILPSGAATVKTQVNSFEPLTKGSTWKYKYTLNGVTDTLTSTMTGISKVMNGTTYYENVSSFLLHRFPAATGYFSDTGHIHNYLLITAADTTNEYYLNDTTKVNGTWIGKINNSGYINGFAGRFAGQIVEQNINLTVEGVTYTGVVHSKVYLQYNYGDGFTSEITYDTFMVKGIGIIELFFTGQGINGEETLLSYSIKAGS